MTQLSLGNGYTIDMADGWTVVNTLQDALDDMTAAFESERDHLQVPSPGNDGHSQAFSQDFNQKLGQLVEWHTATVQKYKTMINNLTNTLHQYGIAETENTIKWGQQGDSSTQHGAPHAI